MQNLFAGLDRPLPAILQEDLEELLTWENNCYLTWVQLDDDDPGTWRKFNVRLWSDGHRFALTLDFGVPEWMDARGVEAILPAHLPVSEMERGRRAVVELGLKPWPELRSGLPKVARMCARLMNELWGPTKGEDVMLVGIDYLEPQSPTPFPDVPGYDG